MKELLAYLINVGPVWGYVLCFLAIIGAYRATLFIWRILIPVITLIFLICFALVSPKGSCAEFLKKWFRGLSPK